MIRWARHLLLALQAIAAAVEAAVDAIHGLSTGAEVDAGIASRVAALELEMERRHAEAEGLLLKAKGKMDAARSAEERARRLAESTPPSEEEQLEADLADYEAAGLLSDNGAIGPEEPMQPVPGSMATRADSKASAYQMKWQRR